MQVMQRADQDTLELSQLPMELPNPRKELGFEDTGESFLGKLSLVYPVHYCYLVASGTLALEGHTSFLVVLSLNIPPSCILLLSWTQTHGGHSCYILEAHRLYGTSYRQKVKKIITFVQGTE